MPKQGMRRIRKPANALKSAKLNPIDYKDTARLRKFISDRGTLRTRRLTGVSVQEQRRIANAVKDAREMALLPYSNQGTSPDAERSIATLRQLGALKTLLDFDIVDATQSAFQSGVSQTQIAQAAGVSQPTVSRHLSRTRADQGERRRILELIAMYVLDQISKKDLMRHLSELDLQPGVHDPAGSDGYVGGPWEAVVEALDRGWLSDEEYETLAQQ